jgi:hypothetical protein
VTAPQESCASCPACVSAAKEREAEAGLRCLVCLAAFTDPWVESATAPGYCNYCGSAASSSGRGATYGRFNREVS